MCDVFNDTYPMASLDGDVTDPREITSLDRGCQVRPPPIRSSPFNRQGVPSTCVKLHLGCKSLIKYRSKAIICLFSFLC